MIVTMTTDTLLPVTCELPPSLLPWLTHTKSLTKRLEEKAGNVCLDVLGQCWSAPDWWDKQVLHINDEAVLHRQILMRASKAPCWYARTIIPKATYNVEKTMFERLNKESLGTLIFKEARIKRESLLHYPISAKSIEYHWLTESMHCNAETLWLRLSIFVVDNMSPFCLVEIMLPGIMRYSN